MKSILAAASLVAVFLALDPVVTADELTIERMTASPSINGPSVQGLKMSPDGKRITFLRGKDRNASKLDLWQFDVATGKSHMLVNSDDLLSGGLEVLSEEEKQRRERNRATTGKSGIISYFWSADSKSLLFPIGGDIYVLQLGGTVKRLTNTKEFETDIKFSPKGTYVSFIRDREVFVVNVASGVESQLTTGATDTIANGMAEFVVQEELGRFTGYWWSPDETKIAFEQYDESGVLIKDRYEVQADGGVVALKQRYPEAGSANVEVKLGIVALADKAVSWIDLGADKDIYLARVNWLPDSTRLAYQRLNRAQTKLDLVFAAVDGSSTETFLTEQSDIWVNIHSDLKFISDGSAMVWASERTGFRHLYQYDLKDGGVKTLTSGDWVVSSLEKINADSGDIYFSGFKDSPLEQHLYRLDAKGEITRVSRETGWHSVTVGSGVFVDRFSSPEQPPQIMVRSLEDGKTKAVVLENKLDTSHPYGAYVDTAAPTRFGTLKAEDGTKLYYRMYEPANMQPGKRYPAILAPYGGPHGQRVKKSWSVDFNQILARHGFVVMVLDGRGMWNRGLKFESHIKNAMGTVELSDQVSGANYLKTLDYIDGDNIGMWGWSYGGYMTLMNLFKEGDTFKAGVSVAPVTDWRLYDTAYTERYLGHPDAPGDVYANSSVFKYVDGFKGDLLLIHGMADDNVFFDNSVKLMATLQNAGKPFELMTYPGKKHGIRGSATRAHLWNLALDFFERKLK